MHSSLPSNGVVVGVVVGDVVGVVVGDDVAVDVAVLVGVVVVVGDVVPEVVGEVDGVVVGDEVAVVVGEVVGVVTSHSWKLPVRNAANMVLIVSAASSHADACTKYLSKTHSSVSTSTAGPRYSPIA